MSPARNDRGIRAEKSVVTRRSPPPSPSPSLLIAQPAIPHPAILDVALGVQHLWAEELALRGVGVVPSLLQTDRPGQPGRVPICHRTPHRLDGFPGLLEGVAERPPLVLQSQLFLADFQHSRARARLGRIGHADGYLSDLRCEGGPRTLLRWLYEVVDDVCVRLSVEAPAHRWEDRLETRDPLEAFFDLSLRGAFIRRVFSLEAPPLWEEDARAERARVN